MARPAAPVNRARRLPRLTASERAYVERSTRLCAAVGTNEWQPERRSSRRARQGFEPRRRAAAGDRKTLRDRRQRRQGVFLDHGRCRRGQSYGRTCASAPRAAIRACPGVKSVMVALTAERAGGAAAQRAARRTPRHAAGRRTRRAPRPGHGAAARRAAPSPAGIPGVERDHRRRVGQRRRRQIDHRGQSRAWACAILG